MYVIWTNNKKKQNKNFERKKWKKYYYGWKHEIMLKQNIEKDFLLKYKYKSIEFSIDYRVKHVVNERKKKLKNKKNGIKISGKCLSINT